MPDDQSQALRQRAHTVLAGGPATLSKDPQRFPATFPAFLQHGFMGYVKDVDGHTYLDTVGALGANLLGYQHPDIAAAVHLAGESLSLAHVLEVEVAEQLVKCLVSADKVRFCLNGSDATNAAVRVARAQTGKRHVIAMGYHGFHDWYIASTNKHAGILPAVSAYTHQCVWGDEARLASLLKCVQDDLAALIVEVPPRPWGEPEEETETWLHALHDLAAQHEAVFILDEVVTGFRYGLGGAQGRFGVCPDLTCVGKALANGYPLAAVCGRADLMDLFADGQVFMSATHAAHPTSLAAAKATLDVLKTTDALGTLQKRGQALGEGLQQLFATSRLPVRLLGNEARMIVQWQDYRVPGSLQRTAEAVSGAIIPAAWLKTFWMQEMLLRGVLVGGPTFPLCCWIEDDVGNILGAAQETCELLAQLLTAGTLRQAIVGEPIESDVFAERYRERPA